MSRHSPVRRLLGVLLVVGVAAGARLVAVRRLPPDQAELATLPASFWYAERMAPGRWRELPDEKEDAGHPPMVKLLYAWELKRSGAPQPDWDRLQAGQPVPEAAQPAFRGPRTLAAVAGVLQVLVLALAAPLGGLWLALDTYQVKYTSQAGLEAIPGLLALLAVLLLERALRRRAPRGLVPETEAPRAATLLLSAVALALAAAGQYAHGLVLGLTFLPVLAWRTRGGGRLLVACAAAGGLAFLVADPALWPAPLSRLWGSLTLDLRYALSEPVRSSGYPWWQPLAWLCTSAPSEWHSGVFAVTFLDRLLLAAAVLSTPAAWRRRPVWVVWWAVGLACLLAWPAKWPQYTLLVRVPMAGCAGLGLAALWERLSGRRRGEVGSTLLR